MPKLIDLEADAILEALRQKRIMFYLTGASALVVDGTLTADDLRRLAWLMEHAREMLRP